MLKPINKESGKKSDCKTIDTTDEEDEGYITIHYEQPNIPALEIPTENNGDLSWNIIQALDSKIISLTIQSKEKRRVLKLVNGIIKEPKGGWKSCKIFALVEKNVEINDQDVIRSTASSRLSSISIKNQDAVNVLSSIQLENVPVKDSVDVSAKLCNASPTPVLPELACLVNDAIDKENSILENASSIHDPSITTEDLSIFDELCAAYKIKYLHELKAMVMKQTGITSNFFDILCCYLGKALIKHADTNVFSLLTTAEKSNILYNRINPTATDKSSNVCELCQQLLTIGHLLTKDHLKKYYLTFHQEIPEIDVIVHDQIFLNFLDEKLNRPPGLSASMRCIAQLFNFASIEKNSVSQNLTSVHTDDNICNPAEELDENGLEEAIRSTASSHCDVSGGAKIEKENIQVMDFSYSTNLSDILPSNPSPTSLLPELACLAKPVSCTSNKENLFPENSSSIHGPSITTENLSIFDEFCAASNEDNSVSPNSSSILSVADKDVNKEFKVPPVFSINTHSRLTLFENFQGAFIHRLRQENLTILSDDPLFLDKFMFIRDKAKSLLKLMKFDRSGCLPCSKKYGAHRSFINHIMCVNHIRKGMTQKDLDCFCNLLSFIQKDENGYQIVIPPSSGEIPSSNKRKANDMGMEADTVAKKKKKKVS